MQKEVAVSPKQRGARCVLHALRLGLAGNGLDPPSRSTRAGAGLACATRCCTLQVKLHMLYGTFAASVHIAAHRTSRSEEVRLGQGVPALFVVVSDSCACSFPQRGALSVCSIRSKAPTQLFHQRLSIASYPAHWSLSCRSYTCRRDAALEGWTPNAASTAMELEQW